MQTQERTARKTRSLEEALAKEKALRIAAETKAETAFASWQIAEKMARENFAAAEFARQRLGVGYGNGTTTGNTMMQPQQLLPQQLAHQQAAVAAQRAQLKARSGVPPQMMHTQMQQQHQQRLQKEEEAIREQQQQRIDQQLNIGAGDSDSDSGSELETASPATESQKFLSPADINKIRSQRHRSNSGVSVDGVETPEKSGMTPNIVQVVAKRIIDKLRSMENGTVNLSVLLNDVVYYGPRGTQTNAKLVVERDFGSVRNFLTIAPLNMLFQIDMKGDVRLTRGGYMNEKMYLDSI